MTERSEARAAQVTRAAVPQPDPLPYPPARHALRVTAEGVLAVGPGALRR